MNIYVGNLPKTTTEESIRPVFEEYGEVGRINILKDKYTNELRGFGFVEMPSKKEGMAAIQGVNGFDFEGSKLIVNEARPRNDRSRGQRGGGGGGRRGRQFHSW